MEKRSLLRDTISYFLQFGSITVSHWCVFLYNTKKRVLSVCRKFYLSQIFMTDTTLTIDPSQIKPAKLEIADIIEIANQDSTISDIHIAA